MAELIGCDVPAIKAVFEIEAAGKFYNSNGSLPRRFEPHHFPREHWGEIGFAPKKNQAAWRASLAVRTSTRRNMFDVAENIDAEATYDASSWGAPQIMGFNAETSGYSSAIAMVDAFEQSADEQIRAFAEFVIENNLATHIRSHNWIAFASGYNGNGQAAVYGAKIESAYRRQSGGRASSPILRMGSRSNAVRELQIQLDGLGYDVDVDGAFGVGTRRAVRAFQEDNGLVVDGVAGATSLRMLASLQEGDEDAPEIEADKADRASTIGDLRIGEIIKQAPAVLGVGGASSLVATLNDNSQTILIGGLVVGVIVVASLFLLKKRI
jgi:hypothetical protein